MPCFWTCSASPGVNANFGHRNAAARRLMRIKVFAGEIPMLDVTCAESRAERDNVQRYRTSVAFRSDSGRGGVRLELFADTNPE